MTLYLSSLSVLNDGIVRVEREIFTVIAKCPEVLQKIDICTENTATMQIVNHLLYGELFSL